MEKNELFAMIQNPAPQYRGKPFWSWNGKLEKNELLAQIDVMREMGFGGFFIHSRTGLETEYLGAEWFDLVRACAEKAAAAGMEVWLYDEDRWPSGTCGGAVTKERKNRLRFLSLYDSDEEALAQAEVCGILSRYAVKCEQDGKGEDRLVDCYRVASAAEVKTGYRYAVFAEEEQACENFYNGYTYINAMDREVTALFLESTHEQYARHCKDLFGTVIKGIFTDEPHRGALFNGFGITNANRSRMAPYTAGLEKIFHEKFGREFVIPELYWRKKGEDFNRTAADYIDVVDELFTQNFAKPCLEWCAAHGIKLTGHILHEDSLSIQTSLTGSCMRYYEYMDYPGIDVLAENNNVYWAAKQCASVARQLGKKYVLSELYGCTGWGMTLNRYKAAGDWQALFGINLRCPHLSWYTMKGEAKRDYPASLLHQNAWWREWRYLEDYFSRLNVLSAEGERLCDTLVVAPLREMWGKVRMGWMDIFTPNDGEISALDGQYAADFMAMTAAGIDFDYGDEELIRKYGKIITENGKTYLQVGAVKYSEVLWECGGALCEETLQILRGFEQAGGRLTQSVGELSPSFRIVTPQSVAYAAYELAGDIWVFLLNLDKNEGQEGDAIFPACLQDFRAERWDFRSGKNLGEVMSAEKNALHLAFAAGEECVLRFTKGETAAAATNKDYPVLALPEEFSYELTEPNVLPLDCAVWQADGVVRNGGAEQDVLLIDRTVRAERGQPLRGGAMLQPWFVKKQGGGKDETLCNIKLTFSCNVETVPSRAWLAKEDSALVCAVNGVPLGEAEERVWVDGCFRLYPVELKQGVNEVTLQGDFLASDGLEAVYLLGDFGVTLPRTLTALPEKLKAGDIASQGFPHYTGSIKYRTGITEGNYTLSFRELNCAAVKVYGGAQPEIMAFAPYRLPVELKSELVAEVFFPRRNTFGPLHEAYPQYAYGPENFLTEGQNRTDKFYPVAQGLSRK